MNQTSITTWKKKVKIEDFLGNYLWEYYEPCSRLKSAVENNCEMIHKYFKIVEDDAKEAEEMRRWKSVWKPGTGFDSLLS